MGKKRSLYRAAKIMAATDILVRAISVRLESAIGLFPKPPKPARFTFRSAFEVRKGSA